MERKLGIFAECLRGVSSIDALPLLKKAGFNCYTTYLHRREDVGKLVEAGNALGLNCESIHAPFLTKDGYCNDMWKPGPSYITMYNYYIESINSAAMYHIPSVVIHFMGNWAAPQMSSEGLHRFDEIVAYAVEKGVTIAFENMIRVGSIAYAADRYEKIPNVRFCYDFGHAHCYSGYAYAEDLEWMDIFTDRVVTTHIHDNQGFLKDYKGEIDFHLVPFEGNLDYQHVMNKMDEYGYRGGLILEVTNGRYLDMPHDEFLSMCFERLKRISDMSKMKFDAE